MRSALILIVTLSVLVPAAAHAKIVQGKDGVYRDVPDNEAPTQSRSVQSQSDHRAEEIREIRDRVERLHRNITTSPDMSGNLFHFFKDEYLSLIDRLNAMQLSYEEGSSIKASIDECGDILNRKQNVVWQEQAMEYREEQRQDINESVSQMLVAKVNNAIAERRENGDTRTPLDRLERMRAPLKYGMPSDEVRSLWGDPIKVRTRHIGSKSKFELFIYPLEIGLGFRDGVLVEWGPIHNPRKERRIRLREREEREGQEREDH